MRTESTLISGLVVIHPEVFEDERGYFFESFNAKKLEKVIGSEFHFIQDNQSLSSGNVLRGLHFQKPPFEQGKLVRVIKGSVLDVSVDIRKESATYGQHFKIVLNEDDKNMLWIPPGFAHGFLTLQDETIFYYKCTAPYARDAEDGIMWNDPALGIDWGVTEPTLSAKDLQQPSFADFNSPFN